MRVNLVSLNPLPRVSACITRFKACNEHIELFILTVETFCNFRESSKSKQKLKTGFKSMMVTWANVRLELDYSLHFYRIYSSFINKLNHSINLHALPAQTLRFAMEVPFEC